jgi:hypothetical protein
VAVARSASRPRTASSAAAIRCADSGPGSTTIEWIGSAATNEWRPSRVPVAGSVAAVASTSALSKKTSRAAPASRAKTCGASMPGASSATTAPDGVNQRRATSDVSVSGAERVMMG